MKLKNVFADNTVTSYSPRTYFVLTIMCSRDFLILTDPFLFSVSFGGSTSLQFAKVKTWNIFRCNNAVPSEVRPIQNTQMCANGQKDQDACKGDSGGPLFNLTIDGNKKEFKMLQIGIVSFGASKACGNRELPTVYTRVDGYLQWITDNVK